MMKRTTFYTIFFLITLTFGSLTTPLMAVNPQDETLEYEIIATEPGSWIVTAKEIQSGEIVKFRLPPTIFKGQSFSADLSKTSKGQRFSVEGPNNVMLNDLLVETPLPGASKSKRMPKARFSRTPTQKLPWEIITINAGKWVVTAKNRETKTVAKFQVHPEAFNGFRFKANLRGISKGQGFSIITPNNNPMNNVATLLELIQ